MWFPQEADLSRSVRLLVAGVLVGPKLAADTVSGHHLVSVIRGSAALPAKADAGVLQERLNARMTHPGKEWDQAARELGMTGVDEMAAAAARQPVGTLMLRSDRLTPAKLADTVLASSQG